MKKAPVLKICGMKHSENIRAVAALQPDLMGFIFYEKSPRHAGNVDKKTLAEMPEGIRKVAVFVGEPTEIMRSIAKTYGIETLQLHGNETPLQCLQLQGEDFTIIKAFPIAEAEDFKATEEYEGCCDYFLFDTKTPQHGGSGKQFDWSLLEYYKGETPFLLSGGIGLEEVEMLQQITHPKLAGFDVNSRFEIEPGLKNTELLEKFKQKIK
ncbi:MAG: phosphoribosylanthranilate isomerase [Prevotellaceae bacterium]|jgi:phosphoribosylanthranilate isomerase|nr:phosphoribosylanthranilate isomerase [Prevotellaceae bacterium]